MATSQKFQWARLDAPEALAVGGWRTACALRFWCKRFNLRFPSTPIFRRHGVVDLVSLRAAVELDARRVSTRVSERIVAAEEALALQRTA